MIRARAEKMSDNENTYGTDLRQVNFIKSLPKVGEPMTLLTGKMHSGVRTSVVEDVSFIANQVKTVFSVKTMNSIYKVTIQNEDL